MNFLNQIRESRLSYIELIAIKLIPYFENITEAKDAGLSNSVFGGRIDKVKSAAMYKALQQSDADMLITPRYDTETKGYLFGLIQTYKVKVSGYNAKVKDLHQIASPVEKTVRQINE